MFEEQFKKELADAIAKAVVGSVKNEASQKVDAIKASAAEKAPKIIGVAGIALAMLASSALVTTLISKSMQTKSPEEPEGNEE